MVKAHALPLRTQFSGEVWGDTDIYSTALTQTEKTTTELYGKMQQRRTILYGEGFPSMVYLLECTASSTSPGNEQWSSFENGLRDQNVSISPQSKRIVNIMVLKEMSQGSMGILNRPV
jgi:hypothetical protein